MKKLLIIGVGGFARELYWHAQQSLGYGTEWEIKGFLNGDTRPPKEEYEKLDLPVLGDVRTYEIQSGDVFACAVGNSDFRRKLTGYILDRGGSFINIIHNTALIQGNVSLGHGNIICPYSHIGDHASLGDFNVLNVSVGIGHDVVIGDYNSFMDKVSICGFSKLGSDTYWATNTVAIPSAQVEDHVYVGVGSVVFRRVRAGKKVFGNPAMPIE